MPLLRAPAKINLTLEVLGRRPDGYHQLRSVVVPIGIYDEIAIEPAEGELEFASDAQEIDPQDNLVVKALRALELGADNFSVFLKKRIPIGAGLGGGSSDAAAILLAAMRGDFGNLGARDYLSIARALGSDLPFFLTQTAAIVEGTGERVTPLGAVPAWQCTVVRPPIHISTATAYAEHRLLPDSRPRAASATIELAEALQRADLTRVRALAQNDFEQWAAGKHLHVQTALQALAQWSGFARLTGSGSAVYTLYDEVPKAALQLPPDFERFDATFISAPIWRTESA